MCWAGGGGLPPLREKIHLGKSKFMDRERERERERDVPDGFLLHRLLGWTPPPMLMLMAALRRKS